MSKSQAVYASMDRLCDCIPIVSSLSNLQNVFHKIMGKAPPTFSAVSHQYIYLQHKSWYRCAILLVPFLGNFVVLLYDWMSGYRAPIVQLRTLFEGRGNVTADLHPTLRGDAHFVYLWCQEHARDFSHAAPELQTSQSFVAELVEHNPEVLPHVPQSLQSDEEFVVRLLEKNPTVLGYASERFRSVEWINQILAGTSLKSNRAFLSEVVKRGVPRVLEQADQTLRSDEKFIVDLAASTPSVIFSADALFRDTDWIKSALKKYPSIRSNERFVSYVVRCGMPESLQHADDSLRNSAEFVRLFLQNQPEVLRYAGDVLRNSAEFVRPFLEEQPAVLRYAGDVLRNSVEFVTPLCQNKPELFMCVGHSLQNDPERIKLFIEAEPEVLPFVKEKFKRKNWLLSILRESPSLQSSKPFIKNLVERGIVEGLKHAHSSILQDREFVQILVEIQPEALRYVDPELRGEQEFVRKLVLHDQKAFLYVPEELRKDKDFVLSILQENPRALWCADERFLWTAPFVDDLIQQWPSDLLPYSVSCPLRETQIATWVGLFLQQDDNGSNKAYLFYFVARLGLATALLYASQELKRDQEFLRSLFEKCPEALGYADADLRKDSDFVASLVNTQNSIVVYYADPELRKNEGFVRSVVEKNPATLSYFDETLRNNEDFVFSVMDKQRTALQYAGTSVWNKRFGQRLVEAFGPEILGHIPYWHSENRAQVLACLDVKPFRENKAFVESVVLKIPEVLRYADEHFQKDQHFVESLIDKNPEVLRYASDELQQNEQWVESLIDKNAAVLPYAAENLRCGPCFVATPPPRHWN